MIVSARWFGKPTCAAMGRAHEPEIRISTDTLQPVVSATIGPKCTCYSMRHRPCDVALHVHVSPSAKTLSRDTAVDNSGGFTATLLTTAFRILGVAFDVWARRNYRCT